MTLPLRGPIPDVRYAGRRLLKRALTVVQFSPVLTIADRTGAGVTQFQEAVRREYPNLSLEFEQLLQMEFRPDTGFRPSMTDVAVWRLSDSGRNWRVSLTQESLALDVAGDAYTTWSDFADRVCRLLAAVATYFEPTEFQRIGARFVNAAAIDNGEDPREQCAPELVSVSGNENLLNSSLLWRFTVDEGELILRSGVTAPATSYDPQVLDALPERQWYLDIDVVRVEAASFNAENIGAAVTDQVRRAHAVYRWAMPTSNGEERHAG
jgi:uncharacterized protein (TIGR04255 family)